MGAGVVVGIVVVTILVAVGLYYLGIIPGTIPNSKKIAKEWIESLTCEEMTQSNHPPPSNVKAAMKKIKGTDNPELDKIIMSKVKKCVDSSTAIISEWAESLTCEFFSDKLEAPPEVEVALKVLKLAGKDEELQEKIMTYMVPRVKKCAESGIPIIREWAESLTCEDLLAEDAEPPSDVKAASEMVQLAAQQAGGSRRDTMFGEEIDALMDTKIEGCFPTRRQALADVRVEAEHQLREVAANAKRRYGPEGVAPTPHVAKLKSRLAPVDPARLSALSRPKNNFGDVAQQLRPKNNFGDAL